MRNGKTLAALVAAFTCLSVSAYASDIHKGQTFAQVRTALGRPERRVMTTVSPSMSPLVIWIYFEQNRVVEFHHGRVIHSRPFFPFNNKSKKYGKR